LSAAKPSLGTSQLLNAFHHVKKYHFDLVDRTTIADQGGHECAGDYQAVEVATQLALKLHATRPDLREKGFKILVTNEDGEQIHIAPLDASDMRLG
jgi:hypothetical protein